MSETTIAPPATPEPRKKKPKRVALWSLIVWTGLCLVWAISAGNAADCGSEKGTEFLSAADAQTACEAGTGLGIVLVGVIWFAVTFVIMTVTVIVRMSRMSGDR